MDEPTLETNGPQSPPTQSDAWSTDDAYRYLTRVVGKQDDLAIYELNEKLAQSRLGLHWRRTDSAGLGKEGDVPSVSWQSRLLCVTRDCSRNETAGPVDWATGKITPKNDGRAFVKTLVAEDPGHTYDLTMSARDARMLWPTQPQADFEVGSAKQEDILVAAVSGQRPNAASVLTGPTHPGDSPAAACSRKFLTRLMRLDPANKARRIKADLKDECQNQCGEISVRAFGRIWATCIDEVGAVAYKKSGPRGEHARPRSK